MDSQLQTLIELQGFDAKIAGLETEAARLPRQIEAIQSALAEARKAVETIKTKLDATPFKAKDPEYGDEIPYDFDLFFGELVQRALGRLAGRDHDPEQARRRQGRDERGQGGGL